MQPDENGTRRLITAPVQPGYVECDQQGRLPGCRFQFDNPDEQCRDGRQGEYCWEEEGGGREGKKERKKEGGREGGSIVHVQLLYNT